MAQRESVRRGPAVFAAVIALGAGALAEGALTAWSTLEGGGGWVDAYYGLLAGSGLVFTVGILPTLFLAALVGGRAARLLGRGFTDGLGGNPAVALSVGTVAVSMALLAGSRLGVVLLSMMTDPFAAFGTALVTMATLSLALIALGPVGVLVAQLLRRFLGGRGESVAVVSLLLALGALGALALCLRFLPPEYAAVPTLYLLGLAAGVLPAFQHHVGRWLRGARGAFAIIVLVGLSVSTVVTLDNLSTAARAALVYRAPFAGNLLTATWRLSDADGDGFSSILLGGDCDDANADVYPGARDVPGNGIDENCSGQDAAAYEPVEPAHRERPRNVPSRQNVVLLQLDALRPDHLSFTGYERPTTPRLDRFREGATWFQNAYTTAPSTRFAMTSAFTGYDARRVPHTNMGANRFRLDARAETVAERLQRAGYDTRGYTISYVIHHNRGLGQGFREWETPWPVNEWREAYGVAAEVTTDAALEYLASLPAETEGADEPFLLFAHYRCTHDPYIKYEEWDYGDEPLDRYDSALSYCDEQIGRLLDDLEARDDYARTSVILFSDHGELFGEHGLTSHGNSLFEPDVRIAMLARIPGVTERTVVAPVSIADVGATVLDLAGITPPDDLEGWSLLWHLGGAEPIAVDARPLFMFTDLFRGTVHHEARGVLRWPHKYLRDLRTGSEWLFDVERDPTESQNLVDAEPSIRTELTEMLDAYEAFVAEEP